MDKQVDGIIIIYRLSFIDFEEILDTQIISFFPRYCINITSTKLWVTSSCCISYTGIYTWRLLLMVSIQMKKLYRIEYSKKLVFYLQKWNLYLNVVSN